MRALLCLAVLGLTACDLTTPDLEAPGSYHLVSVEGVRLPVPIPWTDAYGVEYERSLVAGRLVLLAEGAYFQSVTHEFGDGDRIDYEHRGKYLATRNSDGLAITFTPNGSREPCAGAELTRAGLSCDLPFGHAHFQRR